MNWTAFYTEFWPYYYELRVGESRIRLLVPLRRYQLHLFSEEDESAFHNSGGN